MRGVSILNSHSKHHLFCGEVSFSLSLFLAPTGQILWDSSDQPLSSSSVLAIAHTSTMWEGKHLHPKREQCGSESRLPNLGDYKRNRTFSCPCIMQWRETVIVSSQVLSTDIVSFTFKPLSGWASRKNLFCKTFLVVLLNVDIQELEKPLQSKLGLLTLW